MQTSLGLNMTSSGLAPASTAVSRQPRITLQGYSLAHLKQKLIHSIGALSEIQSEMEARCMLC